MLKGYGGVPTLRSAANYNQRRDFNEQLSVNANYIKAKGHVPNGKCLRKESLLCNASVLQKQERETCDICSIYC